MNWRPIRLVTAPAVLLLLGEANALFGFGGRYSDVAEAKATAMALIRENALGDDFVPPAGGVGRQDAARFIAARASGKLTCGDSSSPSVVSWEMVNDDFCDCQDGSDEPGTSACSNGVFECANRGHRPVRMPSSRVGDGVCDCCDGSDEPAGLCTATCEEASEAWVVQLADRVVKADKGGARREEYALEASKAAEERVGAIEEATLAAEAARAKLADAKDALKLLEEEETWQKDAKLDEAKSSILERTGSALDPERLKALAIAVASSAQPSVTLVNACQSLLDGMDVSDVLDGLLDTGKDDKKGAKGSRGRPGKKSPPEEEEEYLESGFEDDIDIEDMREDDHYDDLLLDDDYGFGGDDYGGYGYDELYGEFALDEETSTSAPVKETPDSGDNGDPVPQLNGVEDPHEAKRERLESVDGGVEERGGGRSDDDAREEGDEEKFRRYAEEIKKDAPFKPPHQFKNFKYELPEAVDGRKRVKDLGDDVKTLEKKIKTLEQEASADYGEDGVLLPLKDKCITAKSGGYEYRVCPFKDAHQDQGKTKTLIGKWKGLERGGSADAANKQPLDGASEPHPPAPEEDLILSGDVLVFDRGSRCWNGPARSLRVALACGAEEVLSDVAEPETCTYTAVLETPAACSPGLKEALLASSVATRRGDGDGGGHRLSTGAGLEDEL